MLPDPHLDNLLLKASSPTPEIQQRSLSNLYTKLAHGLLPPAQLAQHPEFPGLLLSWINDNKKKSELLYKVLYLLRGYTRTEDGLVLLRRYECLEFCEEFRLYLVQNERGVQMHLEEIDEIIKCLLPLGRASQSSAQLVDAPSAATDPTVVTNPSPATPTLKLKPVSPMLTLHYSTPLLPLQPAHQQSLFQLYMQLKHSPVHSLHPVLHALRHQLLHHAHHHYRCKSDLVAQLCELAVAGIYPELCLGMVAAVLYGLAGGESAMVGLGLGRVAQVGRVEVELALHRGVFGLVQAGVVLQELVRGYEAGVPAISLQALLTINYEHSPEYLILILKSTDPSLLHPHLPALTALLQPLCVLHPHCIPTLLPLLPQECLPPALAAHLASTHQQQSLAHLQPYLNGFTITDNLHLMRQILSDLKAGLDGVELQLRECVRVYVDVLVALAISASRQDPLMGYYSEGEAVWGELLGRGGGVALAAMGELWEGLVNGKVVVNYPGMIVLRAEVIEIIFSSPKFVKGTVQVAIDAEQTTMLLLQIVLHFIDKDKAKLFKPYIPIVYSLSHHQNGQVADLSAAILTKIPKNYAIVCMACRVFSADREVRQQMLRDLTGRGDEQPDIVERIALGHYANSKKQLKLSQELIDNYLNVVLNPGLSQEIKDASISEFIQSIERVQGSKLPDLSDAQQYLSDEIKKMVKKQHLEPFEQKLITLHLLICQKTGNYAQGLGVEFLMGLLYKVSSTICRVNTLMVLYVKVFQSPFTANVISKSWVMGLFPHLQAVKMEVEQPLRPAGTPLQQQLHPTPAVIPKTRPANKFIASYQSLLTSIFCNMPIEQQAAEQFQQHMVLAFTTSNLEHISKIAFVLRCCRPGQLPIAREASTIVVNFVRTSQIAGEVGDDLAAVLGYLGDRNIMPSTANCLQVLLYSLSGKTIASGEIEQLLKYSEDSISKKQIFQLLCLQPGVKFANLQQYTSLKLIQTIVGAIRGTQTDTKLRTSALALLYRIVGSDFTDIDNNIVTILTLMRTLLLQSKVTVLELGIGLQCYLELVGKGNQVHDTHAKATAALLDQVLTLLVNAGQGAVGMLGAVALGFVNGLLKRELAGDKRVYFPLVEGHQGSVVFTAVALISRNIEKADQKTALFLTELYTFLTLACNFKPQLGLTLLNTTDIVSATLNLLAPLAALQCLGPHIKVRLYESMGAFLHTMASKPDQFIFRLNKIIKSEGPNSEYRLHYTLMAPVPIYKQLYQSKGGKTGSHAYLGMICWVFYIWKQETAIMEEVDFVEPLVSCVIEGKQIKTLGPLLTKSHIVQRLTISSTYTVEKLKTWAKVAQELVLDKSRPKKVSRIQHQSAASKKQQLIQGIIFTIGIFSPIILVPNQQQPYHNLKQSVAACIKLIDHCYSLLETDPDDQLQQLCPKLTKNLFNNSTCSKILCVIVNEGNFETVNKLIAKIDKSMDCLVDVGEELALLGALSGNESVRSLIVKNRLIDALVNAVIAMDENKVAKTNYSLVFCSTALFFYLSAFKDTNAKIQSDRRVLEIWARIVAMQKSEAVEEKVLDLLINLATFKHSKAGFMACKQIHKVCLGLLSEPDYPMKQKVLQLVYNILYKNAAGIKMYRKKQVIELLTQLKQVDELAQMTACILEVLNAQQ